MHGTNRFGGLNTSQSQEFDPEGQSEDHDDAILLLFYHGIR